MVEKPYKLVLYGATGFVGRLATEYLIHNYQDQIAHALAAWDAEKLKFLKTRYEKFDVPTITVDARDFEGLLRLCEQQNS